MTKNELVNNFCLNNETKFMKKGEKNAHNLQRMGTNRRIEMTLRGLEGRCLGKTFKNSLIRPCDKRGNKRTNRHWGHY